MYQLKKFLFIVLLLSAFAGQAQPELAPERGFVSSQPAVNWEDALISGNGRFGALVYGQATEPAAKATGN